MNYHQMRSESKHLFYCKDILKRDRCRKPLFQDIYLFFIQEKNKYIKSVSFSALISILRIIFYIVEINLWDKCV